MTTLHDFLNAMDENDLGYSFSLNSFDGDTLIFDLDLSSTLFSDYSPTIRLTQNGSWTVKGLPASEFDDLMKAYKLAKKHCVRKLEDGYFFRLEDIGHLLVDA